MIISETKTYRDIPLFCIIWGIPPPKSQCFSQSTNAWDGFIRMLSEISQKDKTSKVTFSDNWWTMVVGSLWTDNGMVGGHGYPLGIILKVTETNLAKNQDLLAFQVHDWLKYGKSGFVIRICFLIPSVTPTQ